MIYKVIGIIILIISGIYGAFSLGNSEKKRLTALDAYISLLFYIKGQIDCFSKPIGNILSDADPDIIADCMGTKKGELTPKTVFTGFKELLDRSVDVLDSEACRLLTSFACELGSVYREEQVKRCDHYIEALTRLREKLSESIPMRIRVNSVLCISTALGLAVLLW